MRRRYGTRITKKSKLLCPNGCGLQRVKFIDPASYAGNPLENTVVHLQCGHWRGEIMDLQPGRISLENIGTAAGIANFPPELDALLPTRKPK